MERKLIVTTLLCATIRILDSHMSSIDGTRAGEVSGGAPVELTVSDNTLVLLLLGVVWCTLAFLAKKIDAVEIEHDQEK